MNIIVDQIPVDCFASRSIRGQIRYYCTVPEYPLLLLVCQGGTLEGLDGRKAVLLFNPKIRVDKVFEALPEVTQIWPEGIQIMQASIKPVDRFEYFQEESVLLSEALRMQQQKFQY